MLQKKSGWTEMTVVLFVCTDTKKTHDKTTEAHQHLQHINQLHEHAGIKIIFLKVDKCTSKGVCVLCFICICHIWQSKEEGKYLQTHFSFSGSEFKGNRSQRSTAVCLGLLCVLLLLTIVVLCVNFTKERLFENGKMYIYLNKLSG